MIVRRLLAQASKRGSQRASMSPRRVRIGLLLFAACACCASAETLVETTAELRTAIESLASGETASLRLTDGATYLLAPTAPLQIQAVRRRRIPNRDLDLSLRREAWPPCQPADVRTFESCSHREAS